MKEEFFEEICDEYEDVRQDHYEKLTDRKYLSLTAARSKALSIDWTAHTPTRPTFLGTKVFRNVPLRNFVPFIDWKCFFDVWELRGKYPNGRFPKIFNDPDVGMYSPYFFPSLFRFPQDLHLKIEYYFLS